MIKVLTSINGKIFCLILAALMVSVVLTGLLLNHDFKIYKEAKSSNMNTHFFVATSVFIHEVQRERGKSALFVNGFIQEQELSNQRKTVSELGESFVFKFQDTELQGPEIRSASSVIEKLKEIRIQVDKKIQAAESSKNYTELISELLLMQIQAAHQSYSKGVESYLLSLAMLDLIKKI